MYFYSEFWDQIVDYELFDADKCHAIKYCELEVNDVMKISLYDARFTTFNVLPKDVTLPMTAHVEFRLINRLANEFIVETLVMMACGVLLVLFFGFLMHTMLSAKREAESPF